MRKLLITLLISLLIPINCFSDSISVDTLKLINIIFVERDKLENENSLLKKEINSFKELEKLYVQSDSLKNCEIDLYKEKSKKDERKIKKLKRTKNGVIVGSGVLVTLLLILGILK